MDLNVLQQIGFSQKEARIYLELVEHGASNPLHLARSLLLPRSTVYSALEALERRGVVRKEKKRGAALFKAQDPTVLLKPINDEERRLRAQRVSAQRVIDEIGPLLERSEYLLPKIEFFVGYENVERFLFDNLERWRDSILRNDKTSWGHQDHAFVEQFSRWIKRAWQVLHVQAGIHGKIISNQSSIERNLKKRIPKREVRVLGKDFFFESSTWVMGDYVVVVMSRRTPAYAFQIHEPILAANLRLIFRFLYDNARSVE